MGHCPDMQRALSPSALDALLVSHAQSQRLCCQAHDHMRANAGHTLCSEAVPPCTLTHSRGAPPRCARRRRWPARPGSWRSSRRSSGRTWTRSRSAWRQRPWRRARRAGLLRCNQAQCSRHSFHIKYCVELLAGRVRVCSARQPIRIAAACHAPPPRLPLRPSGWEQAHREVLQALRAQSLHV